MSKITNINPEKNLLKNLNRYFTIHDNRTIPELLSMENGIWQHPLIINQNKCMICQEDRKHFSNHIKVDKLKFFEEKKIKLKQFNNFQNKIINRNIHSDGEDSKDDSDMLGMKTDTNIIIGQQSCINNTENKNSEITFTNKKDLKNELTKNQNIFLEFLSRSSPFTKYDTYSNFQNADYKNLPEQLGVKREIDKEKENFIPMIEKNPSKLENYLRKSSLIKLDYCDICFGDIKNKFILSCGDFYCKECIQTHVLSCIKNITLFKNIKCPKTICNEKIKETDIEKLFSREEFEKYIKFKTKIEGFTDSSNIPCPIPDCEGFARKTEIKSLTLKCSNNHIFCVKCLKEAHLNKKCVKSFDYSMQIITLFRSVKKCPNCKTLVEKQEGCNNVTCGNIWCNFTFCWVCMNAYDKNHYSYPLSSCFGMQELEPDSGFAKHKCLRITKCLLIFILMLAVLPIIVLMFSFFVMIFYILAYVLDGSAVKNLKLKTEMKQKLFRFLIYSIYSWISVASIPLGYWTLILLVISSPFIYIYKKFKHDEID